MEFGSGLDTWTEAQFQSAVVEVAGYYGWTSTYHTRDSRGSNRGFPDLVICHPTDGGVAFLELKVGGNKPSPEQVEWIRNLQAAGQHAYVVYPRDMDFVQDLLNFDIEYPTPRLGLQSRHVPPGIVFNQSPANTASPRPRGRRFRKGREA